MLIVILVMMIILIMHAAFPENSVTQRLALKPGYGQSPY